MRPLLFFAQNNKLKQILLILLIVSLLGFSLLIFFREKIKQKQEIKTSEFIVRGDSLDPLIKAGDQVEVIEGYYDSHPVEKEDIVVYKYAGNDVPIIKAVKAIPKDEWRLESDELGEFYRVVVNGKILKNSEEKDYQISESDAKMLELYAKSYAIIPEDAYLVLGNKVEGSLDATKFGLIGKSDIVGRVIWQK